MFDNYLLNSTFKEIAINENNFLQKKGALPTLILSVYSRFSGINKKIVVLWKNRNFFPKTNLLRRIVEITN